MAMAGQAGARLSPVGRRPVLENEEMLARSDEPELTTGEILDSARIAPQPSGFLSQERVLGARTLNRLLEHLELLTLLHRFEQPLFPDQRVDEDHRANEQQGVFDRPPTAATCGAGARTRRRSLFHGLIVRE